jgi:transcriptional pleiotropic regulator of transition state genes
MKSTGIVRKIDDLGRVVLPKEIRKVLDISDGDPLEIYTDGECIVLKKYQPNCIFCGETSDVVVRKGKNICNMCLRELKGIRI